MSASRSDAVKTDSVAEDEIEIFFDEAAMEAILNAISSPVNPEEAPDNSAIQIEPLANPELPLDNAAIPKCPVCENPGNFMDTSYREVPCCEDECECPDGSGEPSEDWEWDWPSDDVDFAQMLPEIINVAELRELDMEGLEETFNCLTMRDENATE